MRAAVSPSARQDRTTSRVPDEGVEPLPEAEARPSAVEPEGGARGPEEAGGNARDARRRDLRGEDAGQMACAPRERSTPSRHGRASERPASHALRERPPRGALGGAADEHLLERLAADFDGVVRAGLLERGKRREEGVGLSPALVTLDADVLGDGVEEHEVAEVMAVLRESALGAAPDASRRAREYEPALGGEMPGKLRIGLERRARRAYGDRSLVLCARAKMRQHDRSGAFSLDRRGTTVRQAGGGVNFEFRLALSQPIRAALFDFVSSRVRRNTSYPATIW